MTNPLTTLDEIIWKQFEKVTITAEKKLGLNKWDLARISSSSGVIFFGAAGATIAGSGILREDITYTLLGAMSTLVALVSAVPIYKNLRKSERQEEEGLLSTSKTILEKTQFTPWRPLSSGLAAFVGFMGSLPLYYQSSPPQLIRDIYGTYGRFTGLGLMLAAGTLVSLDSGDYFKSQLPPSHQCRGKLQLRHDQ